MFHILRKFNRSQTFTELLHLLIRFNIIFHVLIKSKSMVVCSWYYPQQFSFKGRVLPMDRNIANPLTVRAASLASREISMTNILYLLIATFKLRCLFTGKSSRFRTDRHRERSLWFIILARKGPFFPHTENVQEYTSKFLVNCKTVMMVKS